MMAIMLEQLDLQPGHRVLEVGAGTGYNAGLMAHLVGDAGRVTTIDIDDDLVEGARNHLAAAGLDSVTAVYRDGGLGYHDHAPYDRIILTVGAWDIAPAWWEQLRPGGRLLLPLEIRGGIQKSVAFVRIGDHLLSSSVEDCGFMALRGDFAKTHGPIPLGPEPGLSVYADDAGRVDADAIYRLLYDSTEDVSTGIRVSPGEVTFGGLALWLSVNEPDFCVLSAVGQMADQGIVPSVMGFSGEWKSSWTNGLLGGDGLCVFVRSSDQNFTGGQAADPHAFELFVRSFGSRTELADRLVQQVRRWDDAGRPANDRLRLKAHPIDADYQPSPAEIVVRKRWTQITLDWG